MKSKCISIISSLRLRLIISQRSLNDGSDPATETIPFNAFAFFPLTFVTLHFTFPEYSTNILDWFLFCPISFKYLYCSISGFGCTSSLAYGLGAAFALLTRALSFPYLIIYSITWHHKSTYIFPPLALFLNATLLHVSSGLKSLTFASCTNNFRFPTTDAALHLKMSGH